MTEDLATWLLEQITVDDQEASRQKRRIDEGYFDGLESIDFGWKPERVLAECDAKRRRVTLHNPQAYDLTGRLSHYRSTDCPVCVNKSDPYEPPWSVGYPCETLRLEALPYVDRPGYRDEWRPE